MSMGTITIEIVYALPKRQLLRRLSLAKGNTVRDAIKASGIAKEFPEIELAHHRFGIHGRIAQAETALNDGDRVEIYRPLQADPKELRRKRAQRPTKDE